VSGQDYVRLRCF